MRSCGCGSPAASSRAVLCDGWRPLSDARRAVGPVRGRRLDYHSEREDARVHREDRHRLHLMSDGFSPGRIWPRWKRPAYYDRMLAFRIVTAFFGRSAWSVGVRLIASTTSIPLTTRPNAGCFGSSRALSTALMKNWLPPVFGPAFAMEIVPRAFRLSDGSSSLIA